VNTNSAQIKFTGKIGRGGRKLMVLVKKQSGENSLRKKKKRVYPAIRSKGS